MKFHNCHHAKVHSWQIDLPERKNWKKKTEKEIEIEGGDSVKENNTTPPPKSWVEKPTL